MVLVVISGQKSGNEGDFVEVAGSHHWRHSCGSASRGSRFHHRNPLHQPIGAFCNAERDGMELRDNGKGEAAVLSSH